MATMQKINTKELLDRSSKWLSERGCESGRLDAELLLAEVLGCSRLDLYMQWDRPVVARETDRYREMIRRRGDGEPVAYILGHKEFYSLEFEVGPGVLTPRPETEFIVDEVLNATGEDDAFRLADIGAGSGAIAVSVAVHRPKALMVATDLSDAALACARRNARNHGVDDRVGIRKGDLFESLRGEVDWIVSNPPYIAESDRSNLPRDVRDYEPPEALFSGAGGLDLITRIVQEAPSHLRPGGRLVMEIGDGQAHAVTGLLEAAGRYNNVEIRRDYSDKERVVAARCEGPS